MKTTLLVIMIAACMLPADMSAQMGRNREQRPALERVESLKKVRLMETLKLDENQSVKVFARYNKHRELMRSIEGEAGTLIEKLESQIGANASDAEYKQTVSTLLEIDRKKHDARIKYIGELQDVLSPKQVAEYMIFERNFARDLRQAIHDVKSEKQKNR